MLITLLSAVSLCVSFLAFFYAAELLLGTVAVNRKGKADSAIKPASFTVLIPAHNEASVIGVTLESILRQIKATDKVVVVADNCSDDTASVARQFDIQVIERSHDSERGKGYALAHGLPYAEQYQTDAIIILDADCVASENALQLLASRAQTTQRPVQSCYLMECGESPPLSERVAVFAFIIKNKIRPLGLKLLSVSSHLTGSGMAFPAGSLSKKVVNNGDLAEDMMLGCHYVMLNKPVYFEHQAKVISYFPRDEVALLSQRKRWEIGHLQTSFRVTPKILGSAIKTLRLHKALFAIDLSIPPFTSFLIAILVNVFAGGLIALFYASIIVPLAALLSLLMVIVSIISVWSVEGRSILPARAILSIPAYIFFKVKVYVSFFKSNSLGWEKTKRDRQDV